MNQGPITLTIGLEDSTADSQYDATTSTLLADGTAGNPAAAAAAGTGVGVDRSTNSKFPAIAASASFSMGDLGVQIMGKTQKISDDSTDITAEVASSDRIGLNSKTAYVVGGGMGYSMNGSGLEFGAATGKGLGADYVAGFDVSGLDITGDKFMAASVLGKLAMTEDLRLEAFYAGGKISDVDVSSTDAKGSAFGSGIYYNPVSNLTVGFGGSQNTVKTDAKEKTTLLGVGAWFKF
jgi:hypothetical protein